ncbi:MAG: ATP-binding protein, partial [Pseudomonadota bacterium]
MNTGARDSRLWLPVVAPQRILLWTLLLALLLVAADTLWVVRGMAFSPSTGLALGPGSGGLVVEQVYRDDPPAALQPGALIVALERPDGEQLSLEGYAPRYEPHSQGDYAGYNAYLDRADTVWRWLNGRGTQLVLDNGERVPAAAGEPRSLWSLPYDFWLNHLFGLVSLLIGVAVWSYRRAEVSSRLLAISGASFFLATWFNASYLGREMALPRELFAALKVGNHIGLHLVIWSLVVILALYPKRVVSVRTALLFGAAVLLILFNESVQWLEWPLHTYYLPVVLYWLFGVVSSAVQWLRSRRNPLDRAALKWFLLSIMVSTSTSIVVYFGPHLFNDEPLLSSIAMVGFATTLYIGLAFGILRFRLFELERWWFEAWIWLFGGVLVVAADLLIVYTLGLDAVLAMGVAVLLVGWFYFPLRQWVWVKLTSAHQPPMERWLPEVVEMLFNDPRQDINEQWRRLLQRVFQPLGIRVARESVATPQIVTSGSRLLVPWLDGRGAYELHYAQHGNRLFSRRDLEFGRAMYRIAMRALQIRQAAEEGARTERQRIMRDLHDLVGGRILSLIQRAESDENAHLARKAMTSLRDALHALDDEINVELEDQMDRWQADLRERLEVYAIELDWQQPERIGPYAITPRQAINIKCILDEAVSNALKHASPQRLWVVLTLSGEMLTLRVENDGTTSASNESALGEGRGLVNIRRRAEELGGESRIRIEQDRFTVH